MTSARPGKIEGQVCLAGAADTVLGPIPGEFERFVASSTAQRTTSSHFLRRREV